MQDAIVLSCIDFKSSLDLYKHDELYIRDLLYVPDPGNQTLDLMILGSTIKC